MAEPKQKSTSVAKLADARARRTRARLDAAFVELLHRRAYDGIRVSDLARKGGVGRATFYAHYTGKADLLRSQMDRIVAPMLRVGDGAAGPGIDAAPLLAHILGRPHLFASLMAGAGRRVVEASLEARLGALLDAVSSRRARPFAHGVPLVARVLASCLVGLVAFRLEGGGDASAAALQEAFSSVCEGAAGAASSDTSLPGSTQRLR